MIEALLGIYQAVVQQPFSECAAGTYPEIFWEGGFEIFLYGRENLVGVWYFFLKNPSKLKKFPKRGAGGWPPKPSPRIRPWCAAWNWNFFKIYC